MVGKTMKIDITGATAQELMNVLQKFPNGKVIAEENVAGWKFNDTIQQMQPMASILQGNQQIMPPQGSKPQENAFLNMFDTMASYF